MRSWICVALRLLQSLVLARAIRREVRRPVETDAGEQDNWSHSTLSVILKTGLRSSSSIDSMLQV